MIKLSAKDETPEMRAYLDEVGSILSEETEKCMMDLLTYGRYIIKDGKHVPLEIYGNSEASKVLPDIKANNENKP